MRFRRRHDPEPSLLGDLGVVAVLRGPGPDCDVTGLTSPTAGQVCSVADAATEVDEATETVLLVVRDLVELRAVAATTARVLPRLRTPRVGCVLTGSAVAPMLVPRPEWPKLTAFRAGSEPSGHAVAEFAKPVLVGGVLQELARSVVPGGLRSAGWPVVGVRQEEPGRWPPGDDSVLVQSRDVLPQLDTHFPPDVVAVDEWVGELAPDPASEHPHDVLGRLPVTVSLGPDLSWSGLEALGDQSAEVLGRFGPAALGGLDERLLNPRGFRPRATGAQATLEAHDDPMRLTVRAGQRTFDLHVDRGLSETDLPSLRPLRGLRLEWRGAAGPQAYARTVAALAMAGVPLTSGPVPGWATALLHGDLLRALEPDVDVTDPMAREVHSIRLRRAALSRHSSAGWRDALAADRPVQRTPAPTVSLLLSTRRPQNVDHALRQVARQRGVHLELVLVTHGFTVDPSALQEFRATGRHLTVVPVPADVPFGAALARGAAQASGDVFLKMDDDDWYGPDFTADLLLARRYSGADAVGTPAEFVYVGPLDRTVRRKEPTENYGARVAGGTLMVDRGAFIAVGGFRETRRAVDGALLRAIREAGGVGYRSHGHGYVLHREASGHTWDPGLDYFTDPDATLASWPGFSPSPLLEPSPDFRRRHSARMTT